MQMYQINFFFTMKISIKITILFPDDKAMRELSDLNRKIEKFTMLIEETEKSLHQASVENHILDGNLKSLLREHERQVNNRTTQENKILELLQEQVTTDQASKKRGRHIRDLQSKRRNMELMMNNTEAQLSEILFEMEKLKGVSARSKDYADDLMVYSTHLISNHITVSSSFIALNILRYL